MLGLDDRGANPVPPPVRRRAAAARARAGARRPARGPAPRRADGRHGPRGAGRRPRDRRGCASRRGGDPAHEPRPHRRRAAGRPDRGDRSRSRGRIRDARRAHAPGSDRRSASGLAGRSSPPRSTRSSDGFTPCMASRRRSSFPTRGPGDIGSTEAPPSHPRSSPRSRPVQPRPAWLIVELRAGGGSLEEAYLALLERRRRAMSAPAGSLPSVATRLRRRAAPDRASRREPARDARHPGRRAGVLRVGSASAGDSRPSRSTSCCRACSRWPSSRAGWSTSASPPPTSGTTACSSASAARR